MGDHIKHVQIIIALRASHYFRVSMNHKNFENWRKY